MFLRKLRLLYLFHATVIICKIALISLAIFITLAAAKPFGTIYTLLKLFGGITWSIFSYLQIKKLLFRPFLWQVENSNSFLEESLISFFELKKSDSPYLSLLTKKLNENFVNVRLKSNLAKEFRVFIYSIIFFLAMVLAFPSVYSGLINIPLTELHPKTAVGFVHDEITVKSTQRVKFYINEGDKQTFVKKDSVIALIFEKPGTYEILGKFAFRKTLPSIIKVYDRPKIDSFRIVTPFQIIKNPNWFAVLENTNLKVEIFSKNEYLVTAHLNQKPVKKGYGKLSFTFTPTTDGTIHAEIKYKGKSFQYQLASFSVVKNLPPRIEVLEPSRRYTYISNDMKIPLQYRVIDEDGIKVSYIVYTLRGNLKRIKILAHQRQIEKKSLILDMNKETMLPGDELKFCILAEDATGLIDSTATYTVIFPTLEEVYKSELEKTSEILSQFGAQKETFTNIRENLTNLLDTLQVKGFEIEGTKSLDKTVEQLENIMEEFSKIQESVEALQSINLSPELLQKLQKVAEELYYIMEKDFPELIKKIENLKDSLPRFDMAKYEELQKSTKELMEKLSYMEQLLELAKKELAIKESMRKVEELLEKREFLIEAGKEMDSHNLQQRETSFETEIDTSLKEIKELLQDLISQEEFLKMASQITSIQKNILKSLQNNNKKQASAFQEKQKEELKNMLSTLKNLKQSAIDQEITKLIEIITTLRIYLLITSLELENNLQNKEFLTFVDRTLERAQIEIRKAGVLILLTSSRVPQLISKARDTLNIDPLASLVRINSAIFELYRMEAMAKSTSQGGRAEALKLLEEILKQQSSMIKQTDAQMQMPLPIPINGEFQSSLQERISKMKSQMISLYMSTHNNEVREKIEEALKEMEKVENKIKQGEFDKELVEQQRKTLKHLLDAYGSYKKEEYSTKRYAEPAKPYKFVPPEDFHGLNVNRIIEVLKEIDIGKGTNNRILREFYLKLLEK